MKRWAWLVVTLYGIFLILLTVPGLMIERRLAEGGLLDEEHLQEMFGLYGEWGYWLWLGMMVLAQALMLFVPVRMAERRPVQRRHLLVPVVTASFLFANVVFATLFSVLCVAKRDEAFEVFGTDGIAPWVTVAAVMLLQWVVWGVMFYRMLDVTDAVSPDRNLTRWLLRGSILELLVAVPSHLIVRNRNDCCAPMGTFWGIVTGFTVMLLSFGPGIFFLFAARFRRLRPRADSDVADGRNGPDSVH